MGDEDPTPDDRRRYERRPVLESGVLHDRVGATACQVTNISEGGLRVRPVEPIEVDGDAVRFQLAGLGMFTAAIRWRDGDALGLEFLMAPEAAAERCRPLLAREARQDLT